MLNAILYNRCRTRHSSMTHGRTKEDVSTLFNWVKEEALCMPEYMAILHFPRKKRKKKSQPPFKCMIFGMPRKH